MPATARRPLPIMGFPNCAAFLGEPWAERLIARQTQANARVSDMIRALSDSVRMAAERLCHGRASRRAPSRRSSTRFMTTMPSEQRPAFSTGRKSRPSPEVRASMAAGFTREGGHLNPLGYSRGLARALMQEGARLYTLVQGHIRSLPRPDAGSLTPRRAACCRRQGHFCDRRLYGGWLAGARSRHSRS